MPGRQEILLTDTVGFVRKLPHSLVEAFKSTLEEAVLAVQALKDEICEPAVNKIITVLQRVDEKICNNANF